MEKEPKYSVIIPVYNAENTLRRCVDSLLNQNYKDAEIILINDGSTDCSGEICKAFEKSSQQIRYICKENGGVSSARNAGLDIAGGKYIVFVDSDDAVLNDYFCQLDMLDNRGEFDFLWFSYKQVAYENEKDHILLCQEATTSAECAKIFSKAFYRKTINSPWNKRYCNEIIKKNEQRFHEQLSIGEDIVFNLQYAMQCTNCKISNKVLYAVYVDSQQSLSRKVRSDLPVQFQILDKEIHKIIRMAEIDESNRSYYLQAVNLKKIYSVYSEARRMHMAGMDVRFRKERIRQMCDDINQNGGQLPRDLRSDLLRIPVLLKMTTIIDQVGRILAK